MPPRERVMFTGSSASHGTVSAGLSRSRISAIHQSKTRPHTGVATLLDLQRSHGNAFVQRLVQRKLAVSQPGDAYGQEADRVADAVVRKTDASNSIPAISRNAEPELQRMCTECEEEMQRQAVAGNEEQEELQAMRRPEKEEEEKLQRRAVAGEEDEETASQSRGRRSNRQ
jgi:hypothetical protein